MSRKELEIEAGKILRGFELIDETDDEAKKRRMKAVFNNEIELRFHQGEPINEDALKGMKHILKWE